MGKHVATRKDTVIYRTRQHKEWRIVNWLTCKASYRHNPRLVAWMALNILAIYAHFRRTR